MVGDAAFADLDDFPVHRYDGVFCGCSDWSVPDGVETLFSLHRDPFVLPESVVIGGIDDGVLRLREGNSPKSIPITHPAIEQDRSDEEPLKPPRKTECAVDIDLSAFVFSFATEVTESTEKER